MEMTAHRGNIFLYGLKHSMDNWRHAY